MVGYILPLIFNIILVRLIFEMPPRKNKTFSHQQNIVIVTNYELQLVINNTGVCQVMLLYCLMLNICRKNICNQKLMIILFWKDSSLDSNATPSDSMQAIWLLVKYQLFTAVMI